MRASFEQFRQAFGRPDPPAVLWQEQFEYYVSGALKRLARVSDSPPRYRDLLAYAHDLCYTKELQADLFACILPVILREWQGYALTGRGGGHMMDMIYSALSRRKLLQTLPTPKQQAAVFAFIAGTVLDRLDQETSLRVTRESHRSGEGSPPTHQWFTLLGTVGTFAPVAELWREWWRLRTSGHAVALIQYASGLLYTGSDNPIFPGDHADFDESPEPYSSLRDFDNFDSESVWLPENLAFFAATLTPETLHNGIAIAVAVLADHPERERAATLLRDWPARLDIAAIQIEDTLRLLATPDCVLNYSCVL